MPSQLLFIVTCQHEALVTETITANIQLLARRLRSEDNKHMKITDTCNYLRSWKLQSSACFSSPMITLLIPQLTFKTCSTRNFNYDSQTSMHISVLPLETKQNHEKLKRLYTCLRVTCLIKTILSSRLSLYPMLFICRLLE